MCMHRFMFAGNEGSTINVHYDGEVLAHDDGTKVLVVLDTDDQLVVYNATECSTRVIDDVLVLQQEDILDGLAYQRALTKLSDLRQGDAVA